MKLFFKSILTVILLFSASNMADAQNIPDFAFPAKVRNNARYAYIKAMDNADYPAALRALIDSSLASVSVSPDSAATAAANMEKFAAEVPDPLCASVAYLSAAKIYADCYSFRRWVYDSRTAPLLPLDSDMSEWTGKQFRYKISALCDSAVSIASPAKKSPISNWKELVTIPTDAVPFSPTLYDFIAGKAIELLSVCCGKGERLPLTALVPDSGLDKVISELKATKPEAAKILSLYSSLISLHRNTPLPRTFWDIRRINYTYRNIYSSDFNTARTRKAELLENMYNSLQSTEAGCLPLLEIAQNVSVADDNAGKIYAALKHAEKTYPHFLKIACIKNEIASLKSKSVEIECPTLLLPGDSLSIGVNSCNVPAATLVLYRLPVSVSGTDSYARVESGAVAIARKQIVFDGAIPFKAAGQTSFTISSPGRYIIVPTFAGASLRNNSYPVIHVTSLCAGALILDKTCVVVTEPVSGAPVAGADIMHLNNRRASSPRSLGTTDRNGFLALSNDFSGNILPVKGTDKYAYTTYIYSERPESGPVQAISLFTDLGIYHPGDTIQWACIAYTSDAAKRAVVENKQLEVVFRNTDGTPIDTVRASTDSFGHISGNFKVPQDMLTGYYSITATASAAGKKQTATGRLNVLVSDYKLPTYSVEISSIKNDVPSKGDVTICGSIRSYSGIPMAGADVKLTLSSIPNWWFGDFSSEEFLSAATSSSADGSFEFTITDPEFTLAPNPKGSFSANVSATSVSGESQSAAKVFCRGYTCRIVADIESDIDISRPIALNVKALDADNNPAKVKLTYRLINESSDTVLRGTFFQNEKIDLSGIASGIYSICFRTAGSESEAVTVENIALYRPSDSLPPRKNPVWVPRRRITAGDSIMFGTSAPETHLLYTLWSPGITHSREWLVLKPGIHFIKPHVPSGTSELNASFFAVKNYETSTANVAVSIPDPTNELKIIVESWRDKIVPGAMETLSIRTVNGDSTGTSAAVMLDMYNAALSTLAEPDFTLHPRRPYIPSMRMIPPTGYIKKRGYDVSAASNYLNCKEIASPELNTYGRNFAGGYRNGAMMFGARSAAGAVVLKSENVVDEVMEHKAMVSVSTKDAVAEDFADEMPDGGGAPASEPQFSYRDSEVPLAFFAPMLLTDAQGHLQFSYTVPDANTTWAFRALAFTESLSVATHSASTLASKPLMVQPNLPRFLRSGDSIDISSQVFNNSQAITGTTTEIEFFNPADNTTLCTHTVKSTIAADSSAVISVPFTAPRDISLIGFRIKCSDSNFADGEQSLIPVLPSGSATYESTDFYMPADSSSLTIALPDYGKNDKVTLTYCDNPLWYVVTALPGLQKNDFESANSAAASIFSAAVAKGLVKKYPEIEKALKAWSMSDKTDSTLVSMLERNADLKTFLLQATPWVSAAQTDTERMQRLSLLYNNKEYDNTLKSAISQLSRLQNSDGGFVWTPRYPESSLWVTTSVLSEIGRLNTLGMMPANGTLKDICNKALKYMEKQYTKIYSENRNSDFSSYAEIVGLWRSFTPSAIGRSMIASETQRILSSWKKMNVGGKAKAALLLYNSGNVASARTILSSLDEFATTSANKGMWWQSLDNRSASFSSVSNTALALQAYATITPHAPQIEKIRQWLILQKSTMDWGKSAAASGVIAAILTSSTKWIDSAGAITVIVNSQPIETNQTHYTGEIRSTMPALAASGSTLTINRTSSAPGWGAVIATGFSAMDSIKAAACGQLAVSKSIFVKDGDSWDPAKHLSVGDKIKIRLILKSESAIDYLAVSDERAACLEPVEQTPAPIWADGICFYRENKDSRTNIFINRLPKGTFVLEYEMWVNNSGNFASGIATAQSQYAPQITAHSAGERLMVEN